MSNEAKAFEASLDDAAIDEAAAKLEAYPDAHAAYLAYMTAAQQAHDAVQAADAERMAYWVPECEQRQAAFMHELSKMQQEQVH